MLRVQLISAAADLPEWACFVDGIYTEYRRYFRDHAVRLRKLLERKTDNEKLIQALKFCLDRGLASAQDLIDAVDSMTPLPACGPAPYKGVHQTRQLPAVATRSVGEYQRLLDAAAKAQGSKE